MEDAYKKTLEESGFSSEYADKILFHVYGSHRIYKGEGSICRWLENDTVIELTPKKRTSRNTCFKVNGEDYWEIWFTQFAEICFDVLGHYYLGRLLMKDGSNELICNLEDYQFEEKTKGKKFMVKVMNDIPLLKLSKDVYQKHATVGECVKDIVQQIKDGNVAEAIKYCQPGKIYHLVEC